MEEIAGRGERIMIAGAVGIMTGMIEVMTGSERRRGIEIGPAATIQEVGGGQGQGNAQGIMIATGT